MTDKGPSGVGGFRSLTFSTSPLITEIEMRTTLATLAFALLFAVTASADVIHETDYEAEPTVGFGVAPASMFFTDGGGDLQAFSNGDNSGSALGISTANPNSGSYHYAVDTDALVIPDEGHGWGASWSVADSSGGSGGFTSQAAAMAAGSGKYINFSAGATFTAKVQVATDALDPATGFTDAFLRLAFHGGTTFDVIPFQLGPVLGAAELTAAYQPLTVSYTLTAADATMGIDRVTAAIETLGDPANSATGMIYFDDFVFEVNSENVVTVGVPEPGAASILLAGLLGIGGVRRRN